MHTNIAKEGLFVDRNDPAKFKEDLLNIAKTTISSKILTQYKQMFAELAVNAVLRLKGSGNLDAIQIIKKLGGGLQDSYLDEGKGYMLLKFEMDILIMTTRAPDKSAYQKIISQPKHMLWVLKRTVSMRRFFWAPKTHV